MNQQLKDPINNFMSIKNKYKKPSLTLIHWNSNSLRNKIDEFTFFVNKFKPDIISINETKCNDETAKNSLQIENYYLFHKARSIKSNGAGGVALLIKKGIKYEETNIFDSLNLEIIAIKLKQNDQEIFIISYYNPPDKALNQNLFEKLERKKFILCGDLNSKCLESGCNSSNSNGKILSEILNMSYILNLNNSISTHRSFTNGKEDILDLILCSSKLHDNFVNLEVLKKHDMNSDHWPVKVNFNFNKSIYNQTSINQKTKLNLAKADWDKFRYNLPTECPTDCVDNVELLNKFITTSLNAAADASIPKIVRHNFNESLPDYIIGLIKLRRKAKYKSQKKKATEDNKKRYKSLTILVKEEISAYKNQKWLQFLNTINKNHVSSRPFWKKLIK